MGKSTSFEMSLTKEKIKEVVESYIQTSRTKHKEYDHTDPIFTLSPAYYDFRTFSRSLDSKMGGYIEKIAFDLAMMSECNSLVAQVLDKFKVDLYFVRDGIHYICEAKTGGNLDNKKAQEEREQLCLRREVLHQNGIPMENIKIRLMVPLVTTVLEKMFNTFERDEVIAGNEVWAFVMGDATEKDHVSKCIREAMNNLTTKLNSEIMALINRRVKEVSEVRYTRQLLMLLNLELTGDLNMNIVHDKILVETTLKDLDKQLTEKN